ncbi:hypothetical protein HDV00_002457 [Rhizophlyctis rosea]|nr:hypothetical protein HDV00_002457 [Rhizophlyctis rosea]
MDPIAQLQLVHGRVRGVLSRPPPILHNLDEAPAVSLIGLLSDAWGHITSAPHDPSHSVAQPTSDSSHSRTVVAANCSHPTSLPHTKPPTTTTTATTAAATTAAATMSTTTTFHPTASAAKPARPGVKRKWDDGPDVTTGPRPGGAGGGGAGEEGHEVKREAEGGGKGRAGEGGAGTGGGRPGAGEGGAGGRGVMAGGGQGGKCGSKSGLEVRFYPFSTAGAAAPAAPATPTNLPPANPWERTRIWRLVLQGEEERAWKIVLVVWDEIEGDEYVAIMDEVGQGGVSEEFLAGEFTGVEGGLIL